MQKEQQQRQLYECAVNYALAVIASYAILDKVRRNPDKAEMFIRDFKTRNYGVLHTVEELKQDVKEMPTGFIEFPVEDVFLLYWILWESKEWREWIISLLKEEGKHPLLVGRMTKGRRHVNSRELGKLL